ncbi:MAG: GreA/GreB family elongation factor [Phycisphaerae bacterium]|nr:GreA/GreB family elongation factor [Phycisphaerae bacterium]
MNRNPIQITTTDYSLLRGLLLDAVSVGRWDTSLAALEQELERAEILIPAEISPDVVTMDSVVRVADLDTRESLQLQVVHPSQASLDRGRVSVLAPVGTALLGCRAGDTVNWPVPSGMRRLRIERVVSPAQASQQGPSPLSLEEKT